MQLQVYFVLTSVTALQSGGLQFAMHFLRCLHVQEECALCGADFELLNYDCRAPIMAPICKIYMYVRYAPRLSITDVFCAGFRHGFRAVELAEMYSSTVTA